MNALRDPVFEFLPAALEVTETPPLPAARWIGWSIVAFFLVAITWATFGRVDIVAVAHGKIVPSGKVKVVQPVEPAVIRAIHVRDGQAVEQGELLIEFDDTKAQADLARLSGELARLDRDAARLRALLERLDGNDATRDVLAPVTRARVDKTWRAFTSERAALREELRRSRAELRTLEAQIARIDAILPLVSERADAVRQLEKRSLASRASWLELEEQRVAQAQERDVRRAQLGVYAAQSAQLKQRLAALVARTGSGWREELADIDGRRASYAQQVRKARARVNEYELRAPINGVVQQLGVTTVGGVVSAAEKLMRVVPKDGALFIEAWVANKDIGFVENGQAAEIKIETFPFTRYGTITGHVDTVSRDAVANEELGLVYLAQVRMARTTLRVKDKRVRLGPGMAVTVEMNLGQRRLIEFLLAPLLRYRDEGLTER